MLGLHDEMNDLEAAQSCNNRSKMRYGCGDSNVE